MSPQQKPLSEAIRNRRATPNFDSAPLPDSDLKQIVDAGLHAPSGYNLQPWRFVVVREAAHRKALRAAAFNQPKVESASAVIVACADLKAWQRSDLETMLEISKQHGFDQKQIEGSRRSVT